MALKEIRNGNFKKLRRAVFAEKSVKNCTLCYALQCEIEKHCIESHVRKNIYHVLAHIARCEQCKTKQYQIIAHAKDGHQ